MSQILNRIRDVDPNNSDEVKDAVSAFLRDLVKHTEVSSNHWLRALENVINRFPKFCMSHRNTIETYLTHFLDANNYYDVIEAAKCGHALQQVRPSYQRTATPKTCWREQLEVLCNAAHALVGAIFNKSVDLFTSEEQEPIVANNPLSLALANISEISSGSKAYNYSVQEKNQLLCVRLRNVFVFLQAMLVEVYPVAKPVRSQSVLDVVVRALTVSSGSNQSLQESDITMIKVQALRTLDALVLCLGPNLIPFSPLVFRVVMQTLRWSSENPSEETSKVRCAAYGSVTRWMTSLRCHRPEGGRRGWEGDLVTHVVGDVTPRTHQVLLTMSSAPTKNMSKKAKRKLANSLLMDSRLSRHAPDAHRHNATLCSEGAPDDVTLAALRCAETLLTVCGLFLSTNTHKMVQERIVRECHRVEEYSGDRALLLLRVLDAARRGAPPGTPPPTQHCLQLYSVLVTSGDSEISKFCSHALLDIRLHLHCAPPSLSFAIEPPKDSPPGGGAGKTVSHRNRAALEALLGVEVMPAKKLTNGVTDMIVIDEPSHKRPRLDDSDDRISVSSDSASSDVSADAVSDAEEIQDVIEIVEDDDKEPTTLEDITDLETQVNEESSKLVAKMEPPKVQVIEKTNIYEANTQMPANVSGDTNDGLDSPHSVEVSYDYPSTGKSRVTVLDKMEDDNLPSTNETDDIQITCGQMIKSSQDVSQKKVEEEAKETEPKVNGVESIIDKELTNGDADPKEVTEGIVKIKITESKEVSVEEMLADFVDEVNEDVNLQA